MGDCKTVALALTVAAAVLSGCASAEGESSGSLAEPTEALKSEAPAFHFESGTLELGDFDPDTLGDDLFDPCTEITEAEFAAAGMTGVEPYDSPISVGESVTNSCVIDTEAGITVMVTATRTDEAITRTALGDEVRTLDSVVPGLFIHTRSEVDPNSCYAQVDTRRGGLAIAVGVAGVKTNTVDPCALAIRGVEELYRASSSGGSSQQGAVVSDTRS